MTDLAERMTILLARPRLPSGRLVALLAWPTLAIVGLGAFPLFLLLQVSTAHRDPGGLWSPGFEWTQYGQVFDATFLRMLGYSAVLATVISVTVAAIGLPLTYLITRMRRRSQMVWLVGLLTTLSLSEVLISFAWQVMLARRIGLSDVMVALGLLSEAQSLYPSAGAVMACLVYLTLPFSVLLLYPPLSRIDPDLVEAARTMGASPLRGFFTIILPLMRRPLVSSLVVVFIFTVGSYVTPLVLGRPDQWTVGVLISSTVLGAGNVPLGAAQAVIFLGLTLLLTGATARLGRRKGDRR